MKPNQDVRNYAKDHAVMLWEIADYLQISEPTMTRRMRREFSESERESCYQAIENIAFCKAQKQQA